MIRKAAIFFIAKPGQIAALTSPVRQVIVDALAAAVRPCSVSRIAEMIGRPADSLYYHLRALSRVGLVSKGRRPSGADRESAHYTVPARRMRIRYDFASPAFRKNIVRMVSSMLRESERDFSRGANDSSACGSGRRRDTWAGRVELRLSRKQLEQVNSLIEQLFELQRTDPPTRGSRRYALTVALSPIRDRRQGS